MKIVYMGTPDFAVPPLAALVKAGYEVTAVITQPDKPKGRGKTLLPTPVKEEAMKHEIPVYQPQKVRDPEFVEVLKNLAPDMIVVAAFGQIIPKEILDMPKYGCINIHASLLIQTIPSIANGTATYTKQPEESPTPYAAMITKKMGLLDFSGNAEVLERLVRGMNPWPSAYTFLNNKTLKVWKAAVEDAESGKAAPGTIVGVDKKGIHVACGEKILVLQEVQLEGKKRMETDAFLRGYQVTEGTILTDHKE